jgi:hypothetical protein
MPSGGVTGDAPFRVEKQIRRRNQLRAQFWAKNVVQAMRRLFLSRSPWGSSYSTALGR